MQRIHEEQNHNYAQYMRGVILGAVVGLIICMVVLLIASFLFAGGYLPETMMKQAVFLAALLGSFFGSLTAVKSVRRRALITGLFCSVAMYLFVLLVGIIFGSDLGGAGKGIGLIIAVLAGGAVGGIVGSGGKKRRK